jgi:hypothetical protein
MICRTRSGGGVKLYNIRNYHRDAYDIRVAEGSLDPEERAYAADPFRVHLRRAVIPDRALMPPNPARLSCWRTRKLRDIVAASGQQTLDDVDAQANEDDVDCFHVKTVVRGHLTGGSLA